MHYLVLFRWHKRDEVWMGAVDRHDALDALCEFLHFENAPLFHLSNELRQLLVPRSLDVHRRVQLALRQHVLRVERAREEWKVLVRHSRLERKEKRSLENRIHLRFRGPYTLCSSRPFPWGRLSVCYAHRRHSGCRPLNSRVFSRHRRTGRCIGAVFTLSDLRGFCLRSSAGFVTTVVTVVFLVRVAHIFGRIRCHRKGNRGRILLCATLPKVVAVHVDNADALPAHSIARNVGAAHGRQTDCHRRAIAKDAHGTNGVRFKRAELRNVPIGHYHAWQHEICAAQQLLEHGRPRGEGEDAGGPLPQGVHRRKEAPLHFHKRRLPINPIHRNGRVRVCDGLRHRHVVL
eukprot:Opistho-1_new@42554